MNEFNRFLLFAYNRYYPLGGLNDFIFSSDDLESVMKEARKLYYDDHYSYFDIFDLQTWKKVPFDLEDSDTE